MGLFLSLSGIINKSEQEVAYALEKYLKVLDGGLEPANIDNSHKNFCVIMEDGKNTTIFYPEYFLEWEQCSNFLSKELKAPVFSLHIYDGDFWTYTLFFDGEIKDKFMPIPDYFEDVSQEEIDNWKGSSQIIANYIPGLVQEDIEKYLICWDPDKEETKAYEDDEFTNCEWQLVDFMKKLKLPYPIDNNGNSLGKIYKFWSKDIPLTEIPIGPFIVNAQAMLPTNNKPWWKFW